MKRLVLVVLSFFFASIVEAIDPNIELELSSDKQQIKKGDQFKIMASLKILNSQSHVNLQQIQIPGVEKFLPVGTSQSTQITKINNEIAAISEMQKTLLAHEMGTFYVGPIQFSLQSSDGEVINVASNTLTITVTETTISKATINQIKQEEHKGNLKAESETIFAQSKKQEQTFPTGKVIKIFLAFFFLGGGSALFFYSRQPHRERKRKEQQETKAQEAWEKKKRHLDLPKTDSLDFYPEMRTFVVDYVYNEKKIDVSSMTTSEVLEGTQGMSGEKSIEEILKACDHYRYARVEVDREQFLQMAQGLITNN